MYPPRDKSKGINTCECHGIYPCPSLPPVPSLQTDGRIKLSWDMPGLVWRPMLHPFGEDDPE